MSRRTQDQRAAAKRYFRPEISHCPGCGKRLRRCWNVWRKQVVTLAGRFHVFQQGYQCPNANCGQVAEVHTSGAAERLVLPGRSFGRDVIVQAGYWRFWQHATLDEIRERFRAQQIRLSRSQVPYLLGDFLALLRAAQPAKIAAQQAFFQEHGMILGLDGMQPEKGNDCLYIVREIQVGLVLVAENLASSSTPALAAEVLAPVQRWGFPVRGIVSDAQESIQQAVAQQFPGVPHHTCHFHCLRDAGKPIFAADRAMKTQLKKALRPKLTGFRRSLQRVPPEDPCRPVLTDYGTCLRSVLLIGGVAPFNLGGLQLFQALQDVESSLCRCQEKGGTPCWNDCWAWGPSARPLPRRKPGSNASGNGWSNWNIAWIGRKTSNLPPRPPTRCATRYRPIWTNWPRRPRMRPIRKWPSISARLSVIAGGASLRATKWPGSPAPTTNWRSSCAT